MSYKHAGQRESRPRGPWRGALRYYVAVAGVLVLVAALAVTAGLGGGRAKASVALVTCAGGAGTVTFNPGITPKVQSGTVSGTGTLSGCISDEFPFITNATVSASGIPGTGSCSLTGGKGSVTADAAHPITITWKDILGHSVGISTITGAGGYAIDPSGKITLSHSNVVITGLFAGGVPGDLVPSIIANLADCLLPGGVTSASASALGLTILPAL